MSFCPTGVYTTRFADLLSLRYFLGLNFSVIFSRSFFLGPVKSLRKHHSSVNPTLGLPQHRRGLNEPSPACSLQITSSPLSCDLTFPIIIYLPFMFFPRGKMRRNINGKITHPLCVFFLKRIILRLHDSQRIFLTKYRMKSLSHINKQDFMSSVIENHVEGRNFYVITK